MSDRESQHQLSGLMETLQAFLGRSEPGSKEKETDGRPSVEVKVEDRGDSPGLTATKHVSYATETRDEEPKAELDTNVQDFCEELTPLLKCDRRPRRTVLARILMANLTGNLRGVHHGVSEKHLSRYLAEFLYRFNRRAWSSQLVNRALLACVSVKTITYAELKV